MGGRGLSRATDWRNPLPLSPVSKEQSCLRNPAFHRRPPPPPPPSPPHYRALAKFYTQSTISILSLYDRDPLSSPSPSPPPPSPSSHPPHHLRRHLRLSPSPLGLT